MFLSKVIISGSACRNPYEIHRALWHLFPDDVEARRDFLFRVEASNLQSSQILMQSVREPVAAGHKDVRLVAHKHFSLPLTGDHKFRFKVVANPVRMINDEYGRLRREGELKKCRVPLISEDDLQAWLVRKMEGLVQIESVIVEKIPPLNFRKTKEKRVGKIQPVCFQGIMTVIDPAGLKEVVLAGIGPAKAFGCGLLSLAKR